VLTGNAWSVSKVVKPGTGVIGCGGGPKRLVEWCERKEVGKGESLTGAHRIASSSYDHYITTLDLQAYPWLISGGEFPFLSNGLRDKRPAYIRYIVGSQC
jgi:hypothetical protein